MSQTVEVVSNVSPIEGRAVRLQVAYVGLDWGTCTRRAYLFAAGGRRLGYVEDAEGALAARGRLGAALGILLARLKIDPDTPVLVSGSAASQHAALGIACLQMDVALAAMAHRLVHLEGSRFVVPGYRQFLPDPDVLPGHATSLLGLVAGGVGSGWAILPGAHCKWVLLHEGRIMRWQTFLTGELFESQRHLGMTCPVQEAHWSDDPEGFERGLDMARRAMPLSQALFAVRAAVAGDMARPAMAAAMLSGLLIGAEFQAMEDTPAAARVVHLIAGPVVGPLYRRAARAFGWRVEMTDQRAVFGAGIRHLYRDGPF